VFENLLIANRGEIAYRILSTARNHGIKTSIISSPIDLNSRAVKQANNIIQLSGNMPTESYLDIPQIIEKIKDSSIDAVHPGYGFLSENLMFRKEIEKLGITFIGPSLNDMDILGDKGKARETALKSNTPILPGTKSTKDIGILKQEAEDIGFPILIKAAAGGGGRGIRLVNNIDEFDSLAETAKNEAEAAFGDGNLFVEKYLQEAKHIEVQIIGFGNGEILHFGERDCSIQRKNQKLIEEAPATAITRDVAKEIYESAINLTSYVKYKNAGTVEFLVDKNFNHYFLEVNTRIQVEHPVTEMITGQDLIYRQLQVAADVPLGLNQKDIKFNGHAIEARVNVEKPYQGFQPSTGEIFKVEHPNGPGVRVDSFIKSGSVIPNYYDSLVSKLIVHGANREAAISSLSYALRDYKITGVHTTIPFILQVLQDENFQTNKHHVKYLEANPDRFKIPDQILVEAKIKAIAYYLSKQSIQNQEVGQENIWSRSLFPKVVW
jgi:acetyl-CoA carboxylase, biotin carboxylase subunit